jgi:hypothetical protein
MNENNKSFYPSTMFEFIHHPEYGCRDLKGLRQLACWTSNSHLKSRFWSFSKKNSHCICEAPNHVLTIQIFNLSILNIVVQGQDWQVINSKNKNRILGKNMFSKKKLHSEKDNFEECFLYLESAKLIFAILINYSTCKCRTYPWTTVCILHCQKMAFICAFQHTLLWKIKFSSMLHTFFRYEIL